MRNAILFLALAGTIASAACGPTEVTINAQMEVSGAEGTEVRPLADMEVQLLPFDRDAIFDSLAGEAGTPEPEIPRGSAGGPEPGRRSAGGVAEA